MQSKKCDLEGVCFAVYEALDIEIEPHVHDDSHLIFVFEGSYVTDAAAAPLVSAVPLLVNNPAGTAHRDHFLGSKGRFLAINIAVEYSLEGQPSASQCPADIARMKEVVEELEFGTSTVILEEVAQAVSGQDTIERSAHYPGWVERAFEMVMDEPAQAVTLARLAEEADIHPGHLARTFRKAFGRTAGQLVRDRQFEVATELLVNSDRPLADLSLQLGFYDQAHFTRFFRRYSGQSPARFRKSANKV
ncbi:MAG: AraC family transcriptional regulator [Pseudomonadota bacterium]